MRVYVPATLATLRRLVDAGQLAPAPFPAFAVTAALRAAYGGDDQEELEYAATIEAARESLRLLADDLSAPRRRLVLAADAPDDAVRPGTGPGEVTVARAVPYDRIASALADEPDAEPDVRAALDGDAERVEERQLLWYARQELPNLLC
ncbi:MAG: DUF6912 family protein [Streptosporangiaceae bacterium]